jgi:hypothetical protein
LEPRLRDEKAEPRWLDHFRPAAHRVKALFLSLAPILECSKRDGIPPLFDGWYAVLPVLAYTAGEHVEGSRGKFEAPGLALLPFPALKSHTAHGTERYAHYDPERRRVAMPADPCSRRIFGH